VHVQLAGVRKGFGAHTVLEDVELGVGPRSRLGLVGPNGAGKTTLLRLLAGLDDPDAGSVTRAPTTLTAGYLPQEHDASAAETAIAYLARRTGVAQAELALRSAASALANDGGAAERYALALERYLALGGPDLETRARTVCAELGLAASLEQPLPDFSGGERARVALAAILLSRFDLLLLDEPTNDLDFDGLERLEGFLERYPGALVVVSHDRAFLDRTVTGIVSIEPGTCRIREWAGGWSDYAAARDEERSAAYARFAQARERRRELEALLSARRSRARAVGDSLGKRTGGADRRATQALRTNVRQAERLLERNELPQKPFEPWELRLSLAAGPRPGDLVAALRGAVGQLGDFRLGPIDLDLVPGERLAVTGRNGSGKSTLLGMLLGEIALVAGRRLVGRRTAVGAFGQGREGYSGAEALLETFGDRTGVHGEPARTLLAKFGLGAEHVARPGRSLSPGERTRAHLAELQSRGVNLLVLDEPTNHLDVEAVEQLELALAGYGGTLVVVSHDRRFLESVAPTREVALERFGRRAGVP
jgi:ATPase subunit of ABC transporter with duplicated ATPase domains